MNSIGTTNNQVNVFHDGLKAWEKVPEELVYKAWLVGGYKYPTSADGDELCTAIVEAKTDRERRDLIVKMVGSVAGPDAVQHVVQDDCMYRYLDQVLVDIKLKTCLIRKPASTVQHSLKTCLYAKPKPA